MIFIIRNQKGKSTDEVLLEMSTISDRETFQLKEKF